MRRWFWRREHPQWRDGFVLWPDSRDQDGAARSLELRVGSDAISINLVVGVADVGVLIHSRPIQEVPLGEPDRTRFGYLERELADYPNDPTTLHEGVMHLLTDCGCDESSGQRIADLVFKELQRLVLTARVERDRRLRMLLPEVPLTWDELSPAPDGGMNRRGVHHADADSIEFVLVYAGFLGPGQASVLGEILSVRLGRVPQSHSFAMPLDGICNEATVQFLETCGWPEAVARGVGRAVAVKARTDWIALRPTRDVARFSGLHTASHDSIQAWWANCS